MRGSCPGWSATSPVARDTFARGLLDFAQYASGGVQGLAVPPVLLSGHHAEIDRWRRREALKRTIERRPDLIVEPDALDREDRALLKELLEQGEKELWNDCR